MRAEERADENAKAVHDSNILSLAEPQNRDLVARGFPLSSPLDDIFGLYQVLGVKHVAELMQHRKSVAPSV